MSELSRLVRRDHDELLYALRVMSEPVADHDVVIELRDRVARLFAAHAEAETIALADMLERSQPLPALYFLVSQVVAAHLAQEAALEKLVGLRPASPAFRAQAGLLRHMLVHHADHEAACLHPALPDHLAPDTYHAIGTTYAAEWQRSFDQREPIKRAG